MGIRGKVLVSFTLFIFVPYILLAGMVIGLFQHYIMQTLGQDTIGTLTAAASVIHRNIVERENDSMAIYYSGCIDYLEKNEKLTDQERKTLTGQLEAMKYANTGVLAAYIVTGTNTYHSGGDHSAVIASMKGKQDEILKAGGRCMWYTSNQYYRGPDKNLFIMARALNGKNRKNVGILYMLLSDRIVSDALGDLSEDYSTWYLTDSHGKILYASEPGHLGDSLNVDVIDPGKKQEYQTIQTEKGKEILASYNLMDVGWYSVCLIASSIMDKKILLVLLPFLLVSLTYFGFMILMYHSMQRHIFNPLELLKKNMDDYAQGQLQNSEFQVEGIQEFESLSIHYNNMKLRIADLMAAYREEQEEKTRQQIKTLTSQLTPHFIYNALNTIKWLAVLNQQDQIQNLTESLISIFMNAAKVDDGKYKLQDELELVKNYAVIQSARFMNFNLKLDVQEGVENLRVPKLLLQPMVENAIVHGLNRGKIRNTNIELHVWKDNQLHITLVDHGVGFDVEAWRRKPEKKSNHTNIGIHNIEEIIRLEFGDEYYMKIDSTPGKGTTVIYLLPAIPVDDAD